MPEIIEPISLQDAIYAATHIPDYVVPAGQVNGYRRARSVEIARQGDWQHPTAGQGGWVLVFQRIQQWLLDVGGKQQVVEGPPLNPFTINPADVAMKTIDIPLDGDRVLRVPLVLAQAIIAHLYPALEEGRVVIDGVTP